MLPPSRLYTFIHKDQSLLLHFLEGQKLVQDQVLMHSAKDGAFSFFRDFLLGAQLFVGHLKQGELISLVIDHNSPKVRCQLETNFAGKMRALILPQQCPQLPKSFHGQCRLTKLTPKGQTPYSSVIEVKNMNMTEALNSLLSQSYQMESSLFLSEESDQSVMISTLPQDKENSEHDFNESKEDPLEKLVPRLKSIMSLAISDPQDIIKAFEKEKFRFLHSKDILFECNCSRERILTTLRGLIGGSEKLFESGEDSLEAKCDFCQTGYWVKKNEIIFQ